MRLANVFSNIYPEPVVMVRDYTIVLVRRDGSRDVRTILARHSIDAIQVALRTAKGDVSTITCRVSE